MAHRTKRSVILRDGSANHRTILRRQQLNGYAHEKIPCLSVINPSGDFSGMRRKQKERAKESEQVYSLFHKYLHKHIPHEDLKSNFITHPYDRSNMRLFFKKKKGRNCLYMIVLN